MVTIYSKMGILINNSNYLSLFIEKFGNRYSYDNFVYTGNSKKSTVTCFNHGDFEVTPYQHIVRGVKCKKCSYDENGLKQKYTLENFIEKSEEVHGKFYDYSKFIYVNTTTKGLINCPKHGDFLQTPGNHIYGQGCPKCGREKSKDKQLTYTLTNFINESNIKHNNFYVYDKVEYINKNTKVTITCSKHGDFIQSPNKHLIGQGCPKCGLEKRITSQTMSENKFKERSSLKHDGFYSYDKVNYKKSHEKIIVTCPKHGSFSIKPYSHLQGKGCPKCIEKISKMENEVFEFIQKLKPNVIQTDKTVLQGKEIDIYVPDMKIAIEFNGLYWHSELFKEKNYHYEKWKNCSDNGIKLISIWEDDWVEKKNIVKSILCNSLNVKNIKIYARKCTIKEISSKESKMFLVENHIQGNVNSKHRYGLFYDNELVSVITFGAKRRFMKHTNNEDEYELLRFANKLNHTVVGGFSRLLKYFEDNMKPKLILTFASLDYFDGNVYLQNNFEYDYVTPPNFWWFKSNKRIHRFTYTKYKLKLMGFDETKSSREIMNDLGYVKIYGQGNKKFIKKF